MTTTRLHEGQGRKAIFLLVLLSHCVLIFTISRSNTTQKSVAQVLHEPLLVFFLDEGKAKTEADAAKEPLPARTRPALKRPNTLPPADLAQPTDPDVASSNAITDWYDQARRVAEDILEQDRNKAAKRAFGHKMPSAEERGKISIFDPAPVRRAGTWDGPDRFYVTDNCYYQFDRLAPLPPTLLDHRLKTPVCKPPPKGGGDAMFKDLTPEYLKTPPKSTGP